MVTRFRLLAGLVLIVAVALTWLKIPLASSQGLTLVAARVSGDLPANDPDAPGWQEATAVEVPLSAQNITKPMRLDTKIKSLTARALYNDSQMAFLVEWVDDTRNEEMVRAQDFRDAAALQFPLAEGQPYFCMGQQGGNVNIWHWKADWQADIAARQDMEHVYPDMYVDEYPFTQPITAGQVLAVNYTDPTYLSAQAAGNLFASASYASPVEDLIAGGFGSLTSQPAQGQNVQGYGVWADGKWRVIFSRELTSAEADDVSFNSGKVYSVAFAAWDGANGERNGQKSSSQWVALQFESAAPAPAAQPAPTAETVRQPLPPVFFAFVALLVLLFAIGAVVYWRLPEGR
jgi:DMSO reductase family type II enzyme heme b subunit